MAAHSVQKRPPGLQHQNVHLQNYDSVKVPTSVQNPRDVAALKTQDSTGLTLNSAGSSYQVAPASQSRAKSGNTGFQFHQGFLNPGGSSNMQLAEGPLQFDSQSNVAEVEETRRLPPSVARVSPPRHRSYVVQTQGGYVHASEHMSHSNYDPHDRRMFSQGFGAAEFPFWATDETQGQSGGSSQGSQLTSDYQSVVQNSPMGSTGNAQPSFQPVHSNYVVSAQKSGVEPGFFNPQGGLVPMFQRTASQSLNTQQSQGNLRPMAQVMPMSSQSAQRTNRGYRSVANMPDMFAQLFRQV